MIARTATWGVRTLFIFALMPIIGGGALAQVPPRQQGGPALAGPLSPNPVKDEPVLFASPHSLDHGLVNVVPRQRLDLTTLRTRPTLTMGAYKVDFRPVLDDRSSPINLGTTLRAHPLLATVGSDTVELLEFPDRGLILKSKTTWRLKPGACLDAQSRTTLSQIGTPCLRKTSVDRRIASFSDRSSPRFIADPVRRAKAIDNYRKAVEVEGREFTTRIAELRGQLADPGKTASLAARIGRAEVERLKQLNDDDLEGEIVNSGERTVEQVLYVPFHDSLTGLRRIPGLQATPTNPAAPGRTNEGPTVPAAARGVPQRDPRQTPSDAALGTFVFLNGFTLGKRHEWSKRYGVTIDPCFWDSCPRSYYVEPFATLSYGIGLRLPLELTGDYTYRPGRPGETQAASVTINFKPIDANADQYGKAGLASDKVFGGQELVAELAAEAGFRVKLPAWGRDTFSVGVDFDLTDKLGGDFRHGNFKPPTTGSPLRTEYTSADFDLLGGAGNLGVAGAKLSPAVKLDLTSKGPTFFLQDKVLGSPKKSVEAGAPPHPVGIDGKGQSHFAIGDATYGLTFNLTPGLTANLWVDVWLWEDDVSWTVWFPQLTVELPPGGVEFGCHAGTTCRREFKVNAWGERAGQVASAGSSNECEAVGRHSGLLAFQSVLTGKYLRGGMTDGLLHAHSERIGGVRSWETFEMYDFGAVAGSSDRKVAFRSTQDPRRWIKVTDRGGNLELQPGPCTASSPEFLFAMRRDPPPSAATIHLRSLKSNKWVIERSTGLVHADAPELGGTVPRALSFRWEPAPTIDCDAGRALGVMALKSELTGKYVRGGVPTSAGSTSAVAASSEKVAGARSWETFDVYDVGGLGWLRGNIYALRSTMDPGRWLQVGDERSSLLHLDSGHCSTATLSSLFGVGKQAGAEHLQSLHNGQWVIQRSDGGLYANAPEFGGNAEKALLFKFIKQ